MPLPKNASNSLTGVKDRSLQHGDGTPTKSYLHILNGFNQTHRQDEAGYARKLFGVLAVTCKGTIIFVQLFANKNF
jgi:hypothetical protein